MPEGTGLDLGGIAKGWLADRALRGLATAGAACVDLGGDIALTAPPAGLDAWQIEVENPRDTRQIAATLYLTAGGVATSGITRRVWRASGETRHHLIDPRSGRSALTDLLSVTVAAPSAAAAEVAAKSALLLGLEAGTRALSLTGGLTAVLLPAAGGATVAGDATRVRLALERSWG